MLFKSQFYHSFFFISFPKFSVRNIIREIRHLHIRTLTHLIDCGTSRHPEFVVRSTGRSQITVDCLCIIQIKFSQTENNPVMPFASTATLRTDVGRRIQILLQIITGRCCIRKRQTILTANKCFQRIRIRIRPFVTITCDSHAETRIFISIILRFVSIHQCLCRAITGTGILHTNREISIFRTTCISNTTNENHFRSLIIIRTPNIRIFSKPDTVSRTIINNSFIGHSSFTP